MRFVLGIFLLSGLAAAGWGQVPSGINFQGRLTDPLGNPLPNQSLQITFRMFNAAAGGVAIWSETQPNVQISTGIYNVVLGSVSPLTAPVFGNPNTWLELQVGSDPSPMAPRLALQTVPYAFSAGLYSGGTVANQTTFQSTVTVQGNAFSVGSSVLAVTGGNVGIGTANPGAKLDVQGGNINTSGNLQEGGNTLVPSGFVGYFNLAACPAGWSPLVAAQGRYLVGLNPGGTLAGTPGGTTALSDLENRPTGQHSHPNTGGSFTGITVTQNGTANVTNTPTYAARDGGGIAAQWGSMGNCTSAGSGVSCVTYNDGTGGGDNSTHTLTVSAETASDSGHTHAITDQSHTHTVPNSIGASGTPGTNAPYIQLLVCQKN